MEILTEQEAMNYVGGFKITKTIAIIITGVLAFALGVIDGISNPKKCGIR